jgi:transcriptional regulator GlxA family with amidase domain
VEYVVRPLEPLGSAVRRLLDDAVRPTVARLLLQRMAPIAPRALLPFLTLVALKGPTGRGVEQLARWAGVTLRTIERRLARAGWAPARVVVQSVRALDAVALMADHRWSARRVQRERRFAHASAVTRLTQQYAGVRPSMVREEGGVAAALETVLRNITHPWPRRRRTSAT